MLPYINQRVSYQLFWHDLEDITWDSPGKGNVSAAFSATLVAPTFLFAGERNTIDKIILEFRDYDRPEELFDTLEFTLRDRSEMP